MASVCARFDTPLDLRVTEMKAVSSKSQVAGARIGERFAQASGRKLPRFALFGPRPHRLQAAEMGSPAIGI